MSFQAPRSIIDHFCSVNEAISQPRFALDRFRIIWKTIIIPSTKNSGLYLTIRISKTNIFEIWFVQSEFKPLKVLLFFVKKKRSPDELEAGGKPTTIVPTWGTRRAYSLGCHEKFHFAYRISEKFKISLIIKSLPFELWYFELFELFEIGNSM